MMKIPDGHVIDSKTGALVSLDRTITVKYDAAYIQRYRALPEHKLSTLRADLILRTCAFQHARNLCDVGFGTGSFGEEMDRRGFAVCGYDVVDTVSPRIRRVPWSEAVSTKWGVLTFFDSLEHMPVLEWIPEVNATWIVISTPWCHFHDLGDGWFNSWRHHKPGEHLWYFTPASLVSLFSNYKCVYAGNPEDVVRKAQSSLPNILTVVLRRC